MACEILDYRYTSEWNLDSILRDDSFRNNLQPYYPLVVSTQSGLDYNAQTRVWQDFLDNRKKGRPRTMRNSTPDSVTSYAAEQLGVKQQIVTLQAECAASTYAFYHASLISLDLQQPVLVFAADNLVSDYATWYFNSYGALDNSTGRPFDASSRGFRMGSGACVFLIKHSSVKLQIDPLAVIKNFWFYTNPLLVANPGSEDDIIKNIGQINYKNIDLWIAHATGTPVGDIVEYNFFKKTIDHDCPIIGYKGYIGHCLSASAGMELAMLLEDKKKAELSPNIILGNPIVDDPRILTNPAKFNYKHILKTSLGFGGKIAAMEIDL
jgi:3-oxoacyl-(acyl-carrier-protein) synthase